MFEVEGLHRRYDHEEKEVQVLKGLSFSCQRGEFIGIFGASGSGKSTFLHILGGLDTPSSGSVKFGGADLYSLSENDLAAFRNKSIGFVFQAYHLLPEFSAMENVMLPCMIAGYSKKESAKMAESALLHVDLLDRRNHRPSEMSGGEQQRVAIARAIVMKPLFVLADEPTGNLDEAAGFKIFSYLEKMNKDFDTGLIMVTHNPELLKRIPKRLELKNGLLNEAKA